MRGATFNGAIGASTGIVVNFSRATATRDAAGTARAADQPRYSTRRLLCGSLPEPTVHFSPGGSCLFLDAGYASDNTTPLWISYHTAGALMRLWSGTFTGAGSTFNVALAATGTRTANMVTGLNLNGVTVDLFRNQQAIAGYADECWVPRAAAICHGLICIKCQVWVKDSADNGSLAAHWRGQHVGVVFVKASDWLASPGTGFFGRSRSSRLHTNTAGAIGAVWALRWDYLPRDGVSPRKVWFNGVDYQAHAQAYGGTAFAVPAARSSTTADDWSIDGVVETLRNTLAGDVRHFHATAMRRNGALGVMQATSTGDNASNQSVCVSVLSSEGSATAHDTTYRAGLSVAADAVNWYNTGTPTNWTLPTIPGYGGGGVVNGAIDADGAVTPGTDSAVSYPGNQFVGVAQTASGFVCGADETSDGVLSCTPGTPSDPLEFRALWSPQRVHCVAAGGSPSVLTHSWSLFYIDERNPLIDSSGFVVNLVPGESYPTALVTSRILWSPNGSDVQEVFAHGSSVLHAVRYLGGRIYYGSGNDIRSVPEPSASRAVRPLQLAPGGVNYAPAALTVTDTVGGGQVTITPVAYASAPAGLPAMDATNTVYHIVHTGASGANCCSVLIGRDVPEATKEAVVKFFIRNSSQAERTLDDVSQSLGLSFWVAVAKESDGTSSTTSGTALRNFVQRHGEWISVAIRVPVQALKAFSGVNCRITLGIVINNGQAGPADFWFARDGVYVCDPTSGDDRNAYPITPATTGADEVCVVDGFSMPIAGPWTLVFDGFIPREPYWGAEHAAVFTTTSANKTSDTSVTLTGGPSTDYISGGLLRIGTSANSGLTGIRISSYNTGTKVATLAEPLTGVANGTVTATVLKPRFDTVNSIDRPREIFALLTADGQDGIAVYMTTSKAFAGYDGHYLGYARISAGAVDWSTYIEGGAGGDWCTPGDSLRMVMRSDPDNTALTGGVALGGGTLAHQSDFGSIWGSFAGTEVFTKVRLGGCTGVTPLDVAYVGADEDTLLTDEALSDGFGGLTLAPAGAGGGGNRRLSIGLGMGLGSIGGLAGGGGIGS